MSETTKQIATKYADLIMQDNASKSASVPTQFARVHAAIIEATEHLTRERDALQATVGSLQSTVQNLREAILKAVAEKKDAVERLIEMQTTESERIKQLEATVEKCRAAQKRVMDKCEQYWNEEPPKGPEFRAMLEYMHIQLRLTAERAKGGGDA